MRRNPSDNVSGLLAFNVELVHESLGAVCDVQRASRHRHTPMRNPATSDNTSPADSPRRSRKHRLPDEVTNGHMCGMDEDSPLSLSRLSRGRIPDTFSIEEGALSRSPPCLNAVPNIECGVTGVFNGSQSDLGAGMPAQNPPLENSVHMNGTHCFAHGTGEAASSTDTPAANIAGVCPTETAPGLPPKPKRSNSNNTEAVAAPTRPPDVPPPPPEEEAPPLPPRRYKPQPPLRRTSNQSSNSDSSVTPPISSEASSETPPALPAKERQASFNSLEAFAGSNENIGQHVSVASPAEPVCSPPVVEESNEEAEAAGEDAPSTEQPSVIDSYMSASQEAEVEPEEPVAPVTESAPPSSLSGQLAALTSIPAVSAMTSTSGPASSAAPPVSTTRSSVSGQSSPPVLAPVSVCPRHGTVTLVEAAPAHLVVTALPTGQETSRPVNVLHSRGVATPPQGNSPTSRRRAIPPTPSGTSPPCQQSSAPCPRHGPTVSACRPPRTSRSNSEETTPLVATRSTGHRRLSEDNRMGTICATPEVRRQLSDEERARTRQLLEGWRQQHGPPDPPPRDPAPRDTPPVPPPRDGSTLSTQPTTPPTPPPRDPTTTLSSTPAAPHRPVARTWSEENPIPDHIAPPPPDQLPSSPAPDLPSEAPLVALTAGSYDHYDTNSPTHYQVSSDGHIYHFTPAPQPPPPPTDPPPSLDADGEPQEQVSPGDEIWQRRSAMGVVSGSTRGSAQLREQDSGELYTAIPIQVIWPQNTHNKHPVARVQWDWVIIGLKRWCNQGWF